MKKMVQRWVAHLEAQGKSHHTIETYSRSLEHFIRWYRIQRGTARSDIARVTSSDLYQWKAYQQAVEQARPATIKLRFAALSSFFAWATANQLLTQVSSFESAALHVSLPPRELKFLDADELRRFLGVVYANGNHRDIAITELLVGTGLRVNELLQLRLGDLRIGQRVGHKILEPVEVGQETLDGQITLRETKHNSDRHVPVPPNVVAALLAYLRMYAQLDDRLVDNEAPLWQGKRGPLSDRTSIRRILKKYALQANLESFGPETLRHTFAKHFLETNPGELGRLALILGHTSLRTARLYEEALSAPRDPA